MSILVILLVVVLNLVPEGVESFTVTMPDRETIRFTKQDDGGWSALKLSDKEDLGRFSIDGTKVTTHANGKSSTVDLSKILGVDEDVEWAKLEQIKLGTNVVQIQKKADGIDFVVSERKGDRETKTTMKVRWVRGDR